MNRAVVALRGLRARPARTVAALMLAMLVVQLAAQCCAWHGGAVDAFGRAPFPWRGEATAATPAPVTASNVSVESPVAVRPSSGADSSAAASDPSTPCGAQVWCELGQMPPLASPVPPVVAQVAFEPDPALSAVAARFLSCPEERPPTA
jgi:hypothetical protein